MPTEHEYSDLSNSDKKKEDWMNSKWRPMMGWMYMGVCCFDFVIAPVLWSLTQALFHGGVNVQWQPLTLQGAGLFHIAMGAVLGLAAYGRTQEKLAGANNGGLTQSVGTTYVPPGSQPVMNNNFGGPNGFNNNSSFVGSPTAGVANAGSFVSSGFGGAGNSTPPSVLPAGVGAPPAFGSKPAGPGATAFPPL